MNTADFNPNDLTTNNNLFGLPCTIEDAKTIVIPAPWEVTVSYRGGTFLAPEAILKASGQVDLYDPLLKDAWKYGISMLPISKEWLKKNRKMRAVAEKCIKYLEKGGNVDDAKIKNSYAEVNAGCAEFNAWIKAETLKFHGKGKIVAVLGGDHSTPLGHIQALAENYKKYSILHIDAHADLRKAYEGFTYSHASIMFNALSVKNVDKITLVGIRDYCEEEANLIKKSHSRVILFDDASVKRKLFEGMRWARICDEIMSTLSENVYVSFDIDGLNPALCPHTGTPVPGGLEYEQIFYLLEQLLRRKKRIIGFALCEVAQNKDDDWDANVGARVLYRLSNLAVKSQQD